KIGELKSRIKNLYLKTKENYNVDPENKDIIKIEDFSIDEAKLKVGMLKEKLNTLGQVNFMALEEYDEQNERLTFLNKQVKDLEDSEKNLNATISEINQTAELKFYDTLVKVNLHFKELFQTLFGKEGYAELNLSEGDPLESNIEIIAKPPGKKPHSIEMLSGGEKTLTSIALLFSIYLVKPSPFCILDEVDAPLDDTNIDKFINLIRQFSNNTQFLIVTHNKKTMEASDSLYGITMPEEGISKVVSVKLSPELN
ncbi:MAG: AAA family ATPase, partial [FCB group bacterium]